MSVRAIGPLLCGVALVLAAATSGSAQSGATVTIVADQDVPATSYHVFHSDGKPARASYILHVDIPGLKTASGAKPNSESLAGVKVSIEQDPGGIIIVEGTTNVSGDFVFRPAKPGSYILRFSDDITGKRAIGTIKIDKVGPLRLRWARYWRPEIQ